MKKPDIVCIALPAWDGNYMKPIVHLSKQLAREHRVLFVEYAFTAKDAMLALLGKKEAPLRRFLSRKASLREVTVPDGHPVHVLTPPLMLPTGGLPQGHVYDSAIRVNSQRLLKSVRWAMDQLHMEAPIVVNAFNPVYGEALAGKLDEQLLAYFCYDEIRGTRWNSKHGTAAEEAFLPLTDLVITTSVGLQNARQATHDNCWLIKNGVEFDLFNQGAGPSRTGKHAYPVVGYVGSLDDRVDYKLLETVCLSLPQHTFHFVGRVTDPSTIAALEHMPNVQFFGAQAPERLPEFLREMDVCLMPFATTTFTRGMYPLKINEYFAAGKPVVSTRFAPLAEFEGDIHYASGPFSFARAIQRASATDNASFRARRIAKARQNDWSARGHAMRQALAQALASKKKALSIAG